MKKFINLLSIISAYVTCIIIICTFLTSYQFVFMGLLFTSYKPIQIALSVTMILLGIRFILNEEGKRKIVMFFICLFIAGVLLYSTLLVK